ncbi:alpha-L-fucosidase [Pontiella sulfatireligans]|uniref:alpha-L-fucosidase n=1 Tax=Pontiella sulfatireligans TaxID=2750658 RepID=A0A6C2UQH3_9BACT|nr:alpha-L-fucosidase [Pontiella sulfatireligans]VGO21256.1 hypothetical protein SCARR_03328 [Pontiella sulfatireligans]
MKKWMVAGLVGLMAAGVPGASAKTEADLKEEWESLYFGMYVHYGLGTFIEPGQGKELPNPSVFRPKKVDVQQWAKAARAAGATYLILTAKHEYGFCLWDSRGYDYDIGKTTGRKMDVVGDFVAACKAEGLRAGVHYSVGDFYNEGGMRKRGPVSDPYFKMILKQTEELHEQYPGISIHRFDWAVRFSPKQCTELCELIEKLNPNCLIDLRGKNKSKGLPEGLFAPQEVTTTIVQNRTWMWEPNCRLTPANMLFKKYQTAKGRGANYCVSVGPDRSGRIPQNQLDVLADLTKLMDRDAMAAPASLPSKNVSASGGGRQTQEQLKQLKSLYESGLISKEIYDEKQKELVASLLSGSGGEAVDRERVDLADGLVLSFEFNEVSGSKVEDASGLGNHGKVNGAQWIREGRIGGAYRFEQKRRTQSIRVTDSDSLDCSSVTVAAWIKTDDVGSGWTRIVDKDWLNGYSFSMGGSLEEGKPDRERWHGRSIFEFSNKRWIGTKGKVADGNWHHLAATYGDGAARFYVDGRLDTEKKVKNRAPVKTNDLDLMIGNCHPSHEKEPQPNAFDGIIDEVRVYNRALSPAEVSALFRLAE